MTTVLEIFARGVPFLLTVCPVKTIFVEVPAVSVRVNVTL
jgi:hypothetical protein